MNDGFFLLRQKIRYSAGYNSDHHTLATMLKSCAAISDIKLGKTLHSQVVKLGHNSCQFVCKAILNMYAKCNIFDDCLKLFRQNSSNDAITWNIVLSGFSGSRIHDSEVMKLFNKMHTAEDPKPTSVTIAIILPVCARARALGAGRSVHSYAIKTGLESDTLVGNSLVSMYAKSGLICDDANAMFRMITEKDVVSWNAMIAGFAENKFTGEAFRLFCWMLKDSAVPNYATIANILPVCAGLEENAAHRFGKEIHSYVLHRPDLMDNISVTNALMGFYSRIRRMNEVEYLFARMKSRDSVSWNSVIAGYCSNGESMKALKLFHDFVSVAALKPDHVTLVSILPACSHLCNLKAGQQIHGYIVRHPGLIEDTAVENALISFYAKCNDIKAAYRIFLLIRKRDLISWNSILDAFAESGFDTDFVNMLKWMFREGIKPDSVTLISTVQFSATLSRVGTVKEAHAYAIKAHILLGTTELKLRNALIDAYGKCGNMLYASTLFESLSENRNVVTCNSMISGYVNCGLHDNANMIFTTMSERDLTTWNLMVRVYTENDHHGQALSLFFELQNNGLKPDALTVMSILPVCSQIASVHLLKQCHGYVVRACFDDACVLGTLIDLYSKCGSIGSAHNLFKSAFMKDLVMFTAMVGGYAMHGMGSKALGVYFNMLELGIEPDHVIITTILSACSHAGLLNEGLKIFDSIDKLHRLEPTMEQYGCVVDLLARAGRVNDAYSFVTSMPVEANANIWGALLGACRNHHEVEIGCDVADRLFSMEANNIGNYVVMSNLYAANARWDGVAETRKLMKTRELKKSAGSSWIEVEGRNPGYHGKSVEAILSPLSMRNRNCSTTAAFRFWTLQ
ncbi:putative pentatricopeptide repeat-containing protein At5g08490 isoform X1 [Daucus carota subsp. sativus]|uniref:putative pentatricopeptide repeat-containing protein At5g08490 isoform X1 n=2 Tax=Daucus carota subsp. sativus TaxID=79200 RepID=UPI003083EDE9